MVVVTEKWIRTKAGLDEAQLPNVRSLQLPGTHTEKITHLGGALQNFLRLKNLDLSRNALSRLAGLEHLQTLERVNLYYNHVDSYDEVHRLRHNHHLVDLDLRLNPVASSGAEYRLYVINLLPNLQVLDKMPVTAGERAAAASFYNSPLGEPASSMPIPLHQTPMPEADQFSRSVPRSTGPAAPRAQSYGGTSAGLPPGGRILGRGTLTPATQRPADTSPRRMHEQHSFALHDDMPIAVLEDLLFTEDTPPPSTRPAPSGGGGDRRADPTAWSARAVVPTSPLAPPGLHRHDLASSNGSARAPTQGVPIPHWALPTTGTPAPATPTQPHVLEDPTATHATNGRGGAAAAVLADKRLLLAAARALVPVVEAFRVPGAVLSYQACPLQFQDRVVAVLEAVLVTPLLAEVEATARATQDDLQRSAAHTHALQRAARDLTAAQTTALARLATVLNTPPDELLPDGDCIRGLQALPATVDAHLSALRANVARCTADLDTCRGDLTRAKAETSADHRRQIEMLTQERDEAQREHVAVRAENARLSDTNAALNAELQDVRRQRDDAHATLQRENAQVKDVLLALRTAQSGLDAAKVHAENELQQERARHQKEISALRWNYAELKKAASQLID
eukprot:m.46534 g.46534  ORF g.46534 m.46534 type:complete len:625 (+) comp15165_c0_seq6:400-2274(+)